jgi:hypothetical protein
MSSGEFLTRITIWFTLAAYVLGTAYFIANSKRRWESAARLLWTAGCLSLFVHVAFALHYYHGWSQDSVYRETARQTAEVFGIDWGGGMFVNYAVMLTWAADVIWWWTAPESFRRRPMLLTVAWHIFLLFIFFNATVVFVNGPLRWLGMAFCAGLAALCWFRRP